MSVDIHQLWIRVSGFGDGNIFAIYPKILASIFVEEPENSDVPLYNDDILLPSNLEWRTKIYYQLVAQQREKDAKKDEVDDEAHEEEQDAGKKDDNDNDMSTAWTTESEIYDDDKLLSRSNVPSSWDTVQPTIKRPHCSLESETSIESNKSAIQVTWTITDLAKAGALLANPPANIHFEDESEMRRVYSLIYDVLRYKNILNQALQDISFFLLFPRLRTDSARVWLLMYDLYHRRFRKRDPADVKQCLHLFELRELTKIEEALWTKRIKLAAAVSRLRIKNSALRLSELLPTHLRDDKIANTTETTPVSCWVNTFKIKPPKDIEDKLNKLGLNILPESAETLGVDNYRWDPLCPQFLLFHPSQREKIARCPLLKENLIIMQDKAFCLAPAIFSNLLTKYELSGSVIQSHVNSPRATAYLAALLSHNDNITCLRVFGAGERQVEFEQYMKNIGVNNVIIHDKRLIDTPSDSDFMEKVIAVLASPTNSYSAVLDPIDLICSRGGDLSMLEVLTETSISEAGRKRVIAILEEQRLTLRYAMSRPQIQFVVYETHSVVDAENKDMVSRVIMEMNRVAHERHAELQGKLKRTPIAAVSTETITEIQTNEINNNEEDKYEIEEKPSDIEVEKEEDAYNPENDTTDPYGHIKVPQCDLFEFGVLPDLCPNEDSCLSLKEEGCYIALVQRKEITKLDAKFMIKMAESKGLFGGDEPANSSRKPTKTQKGKQKREDRLSSGSIKPLKRRCKIEVERIAAHTQSSLIRCSTHKRLNGETEELHTCPRHRPAEVPQEWGRNFKANLTYKSKGKKQKMDENKSTIENTLKPPEKNFQYASEQSSFQASVDLSRNTKTSSPEPKLVQLSYIQIDKPPLPRYVEREPKMSDSFDRNWSKNNMMSNATVDLNSVIIKLSEAQRFNKGKSSNPGKKKQIPHPPPNTPKPSFNLLLKF